MLKFEIVKGRKRCKALWDRFSPKMALWDLWEVRECFQHKGLSYHFILGIDNGEEAGIMPLAHHKEDNDYIYFGDLFPEQDRFLIADKKKYLRAFLDGCPKGTNILYLDNSEKGLCRLRKGCKRYFLDFSKRGSSIDGYLASFSKKHRKNLRYDLKRLEGSGCRAVFGRKGDFGRLVELNMKAFGKESDYADKNHLESMKKLLKVLEKGGMLSMISIDTGGKTEAVGMGAIFRNKYYVLASSRNTKISNLGKLLTFKQMEYALKHGCIKIDFLSYESGWKELWNLDSEDMFEFVK